MDTYFGESSFGVMLLLICFLHCSLLRLIYLTYIVMAINTAAKIEIAEPKKLRSHILLKNITLPPFDNIYGSPIWANGNRPAVMSGQKHLYLMGQ